jgi:hypothetical protein
MEAMMIRGKDAKPQKQQRIKPRATPRSKLAERLKAVIERDRNESPLQ